MVDYRGHHTDNCACQGDTASKGPPELEATDVLGVQEIPSVEGRIDPRVIRTSCFHNQMRNQDGQGTAARQSSHLSKTSAKLAT